MRRLFAGPIALLTLEGMVLLLGSLTAPPAVAQQPPNLTMSLVSQSPWNDLRHPLKLSFRATNLSGTSLDSLSVELIIQAAARARSVYELSLRDDATSTFFAINFPQPGALQPGQTRTFAITQSLDALPGFVDSALYPLKVQLLSRDVAAGTLRTPMVFLIERPKIPLNFAWTWSLWEPLERAPTGAFLPGSLQVDIAPEGRLTRTLGALELTGSAPIDLAVSSTLIDQLSRMASGYRLMEPGGGVSTVRPGTGGAADALRVLTALRAIAERPGAEIVPLPYADPSIPALLRARLVHDVAVLHRRGRNLVDSGLRVTSAPGVVRPPFSQLDPATLIRLSALGAKTVLLDPSFLRVSSGFSPPSVVRLRAGGNSMNAVLPDAGANLIAATNQRDPVLAAHATLGEFAATWLELPGTPERGAAVLFPERSTLPPEFLGAFALLVTASPWLRPVTASALASLVRQPNREGVPPHRSYRGFPLSYLQDLMAARAGMEQFRQALPAARSQIAEMEDDLLIAESASFISTPAEGTRFIQAVPRAIRRSYARIRVVRTPYTLASRNGQILVTVRNDTGYPVRAVVRLVADRRLEFVSENSLAAVLAPRSGARTFTFPVRAQTTGRIPIKILIQTPGLGGNPNNIAETDSIVRSTAYSRLALFLTIGAAVFLLGWWGRRFVPRPGR